MQVNRWILLQMNNHSNVLPIEINIIFEIYISWDDRKEDTNLGISNWRKHSKKHLSGSGEKKKKNVKKEDGRQLQKLGGSYKKT